MLPNERKLKQKILEAEKKIKNYIRETPVEYSNYFSNRGRCFTFLKLENFQITGSFKVRGAMNKLLSHTLNEREVITASSGNHALAVAYALSTLGGKGTIYLPTSTTQTKIEALKNYDLEILVQGVECAESEILARNIAKQKNLLYISPYNDIDFICGQGTIATELVRQITKFDSVLVSVGGGGLISGIGAYLKNINPNIEIIGCIPESSPVMYESIKAGKIIEMEIKETLSDGTAGGIEPNAITFEFCKHFVDEFIVVNETEIAQAIRLMIEKHHILIEGAAGVSIAAFLKVKERFKGKTVVIIICGANIGLNKLYEVLCKF